MNRASRKLLITISGTSGAGKGTTAALLAKKFGLKHYSIGDIRRNLARSKGMTLEELNRYGEQHPETDRNVDEWQGTMAKRLGRGIFDGRVSFHFIPQSVKIFLTCSRRVGAWRIMHDRHEKRRYEADLSTLAKTIAAQDRRRKSDAHRYRKYYGLNIFDRRHYDLVMSTTQKTPSQVIRAIERFLAAHQKKAKISHRVPKQGKRKPGRGH